MASAIQNYRELVALLDTHPEWRAELRRLVLTDDLLDLPAIVRALAEAQARTERRMEELAEAQARTERRIEELAEAQARTEQRLEQLAEAQAATQAQLQTLVQHVDVLAQRLDILAQRVDRLTDQVGQMRGDWLELRYMNHAPGYFGQWLRRVRPLTHDELWDLVEDRVPQEDLRDVLLTDLLVRGRLSAGKAAGAEAFLAVEVSAVVDEADVARARRRASHLRRTGIRAIPVAAGEQITPDAEAEARSLPVALVVDGQPLLWEEALATWVNEPC
jgi:hypothetical protein